jgi:hypothetical protein
VIREVKLRSIADGRLTELTRIGGGEGFETYTGRFEGESAFITDSGTLADFLDAEDAVDLVSVRVFENEKARDEYLEVLRRTTPSALGT